MFAGRFPEIITAAEATGATWHVAIRGAAGGRPCIVLSPRRDVGFGLRVNETFTMVQGLHYKKYRIDALYSKEQNDEFIKALVLRCTLADWSRDDIFSEPQLSWNTAKKRRR